MKPAAHLRWSVERLLDQIRDELRLHMAQRREAVFGLLGVSLLFALSVFGEQELREGSAIPSFQALALVASLTSALLWFRILRAKVETAPNLDGFAGGEELQKAPEVEARLGETRDQLLVCARELRAVSHTRRGQLEQAWWAGGVGIGLALLILALRWLA